MEEVDDESNYNFKDFWDRYNGSITIRGWWNRWLNTIIHMHFVGLENSIIYIF